ncbi:MAG: ABC transporter permease [Planctomycetes bacterium]|nr:ABC transporter permease [Planctomycetota bacterium]MCD7895415.1 ABC transporter permease [Planctomycetaceae bacterium]
MNPSLILEHLLIVFLTVVATILFGLPLGVLAYLSPSARRPILWAVEILQTIPALALLGLIMVVAGAGKATVVAGLTLYSMLPVVHNTYLGLSEVSPAIKEAAVGMGMSSFHRLVNVELPIAFPVIFTGIRIATVTAIGVAVFANAVGGGGLGSVIARGIHTQNMRLILYGTLSLMLMAILFDSVMAYIEIRLHRHRRS